MVPVLLTDAIVRFGRVLWYELRLGMRAPVYASGTRLGLGEVNYVCLGGSLTPSATAPPTGTDKADEKDNWRVGASRAQESARGNQPGREGYYYRLQRPFP